MILKSIKRTDPTNSLRSFWKVVLTCCILVTLASCTENRDLENIELKKVEPENGFHTLVNSRSMLSFDSTELRLFFTKYSSLNDFKRQVEPLYNKNGYHLIWYDKNGLIEFANSLYNQSNQLETEGIHSTFPAKNHLEGVFNDLVENNLSEVETEIMLSCLYVFYCNKVYKGIDEKETRSIGWLLPRKQVSYTTLLDSLLLKPSLMDQNENVLFFQYYLLRKHLKKYREIETKGMWKEIEIPSGFKSYKLGDTAAIILDIKEKLFLLGDLKVFKKNNLYDEDLVEAMGTFNDRYGFNSSSLIQEKHIQQLNVPIHKMIEQIVVNMERCRWIDPEMVRAREFIVVNIPAFMLNFYRDGKNELSSPVVVGSTLNKTVIFSGELSSIVFSPYWNVPNSILKKEILPEIAKNRNYLATKNMEWYKGTVRQKPGKNNSLGQVKFLFPNANNIYLHDTPSKSLFEKEERAFSHGCIRVGKPKELAMTILREDPNWTSDKIDKAMNSGRESWYALKKKIPVYIGYFTCWVDNDGNLKIIKDIYKRDERLLSLLLNYSKIEQ